MKDEVCAQYIWMAFIFVILMFCYHSYKEHMADKGKAISNYLFIYHSLEIPPEQAKYFDINVNQYDIQLKDMDVFMGSITQ